MGRIAFETSLGTKGSPEITQKGGVRGALCLEGPSPGMLRKAANHGHDVLHASNLY